MSSTLADFPAGLTWDGILCHGLDFDDTYLGGVVHPTVSALPYALSVGVQAGSGSKDLIVAYILGIEVAALARGRQGRRPSIG